MKRYVATFEVFLYATSDENAKRLAQSIATNERFTYDNGCTVTSLTLSNFGKIETPKKIIQ